MQPTPIVMIPIEAMREEPVKALGSIVGVLCIAALLWAVGAVAQGQVQRAELRAAQAVQMPQGRTVVVRCVDCRLPPT